MSISKREFRRVLAGVALSLAGTLAISGQANAVETLKWAHVYETGTPMHQQALWAAERFQESTDGRYKINVFPASSLGTQSQIDEGLSFGTVDIVYTGTQFAGQHYGPIGIGGAPYIFRNYEHLAAYRDSDLFEELAAGYQKATRNVPLAMNYYGERHVTSSTPVRIPDDMKGLKIRTPDAPMYMMFPRAVGANVTPIAFAELYLALQQGVVDAQENPLHIIRSNRIYEVQDYISLTGHITDSLLTIVSGTTWNKLSSEDQATLRDILKEAALRTSNAVLQSELDLISWFEDEGVTVIEVDRELFRKLTLPSIEGNWSDEVFQRLNAL